MSKTYKARDGQIYPWPPPENWYLAADGQWWPPDAGPAEVEPPALAEGPGRHALTAVAEPEARVATADPAADVITAPTEDDEPVASDPSGPASDPSTSVEPPTAAGGGRPLAPGGDDRSPVPGDPVPGDRPRSSAARWALAVVGLVVAAGLGVGLYLAGRGDGDDDVWRGEATGQTSLDGGVAPSQADGVGDGADVTPTTQAEDAATDLEAETTVARPGAEQGVARFEELVADNGLVVEDQLSDDTIVSFGTAYCQLATVSDDASSFEKVKDVAMGDTDTGLTRGELDIAVSAAVLSFCPDEADRLGVSLDVM